MTLIRVLHRAKSRSTVRRTVTLSAVLMFVRMRIKALRRPPKGSSVSGEAR